MPPQRFPAWLLREPLVGYYTDTYNTLTSIVQGLALGLMFTDSVDLIRHPSARDWLFWLNCLTVTLTVGLVWHRYISHNQFLAWRPGFRDALLPMAFAVCQMGLAMAAREAGSGVFSFWILSLSICALAAYQNTVQRIKEAAAIEALVETAKDTALGHELHLAITAFQHDARRDLVLAVAAFGWAWGMALMFDRVVEAVCVFAVVLGCCLRLFGSDLPRHLSEWQIGERSSEEAPSAA